MTRRRKCNRSCSRVSIAHRVRGVTTGSLATTTVYNAAFSTFGQTPKGALTDYAGNAGTNCSACCSGSNQGPPSGQRSGAGYDIQGYFKGSHIGPVPTASPMAEAQLPSGRFPTDFRKLILSVKNDAAALLRSKAWSVPRQCQADDQSMYQGYDWDTSSLGRDSIFATG